MVASLWSLLSLSPATARIVAASALVILFVLDVIASGDDTPGNTPRELVLKLSQGRRRAFCGAAVPFMVGVLIGHFFHPWGEKPFDWGWANLLLVLVLGALLGFLHGWKVPIAGPRGARRCGWLGLAGVAAGVLVWPSG
jgi:hypothetical protein